MQKAYQKMQKNGVVSVILAVKNCFEMPNNSMYRQLALRKVGFYIY